MTATLTQGPVDLAAVPSTVLVVGGTGMLAGTVTALASSGRSVLLASRHASRSPLAGHESVLAVDTDWSDAGALADAVVAVASDAGLEIGAALLWVHLPHRDPVAVALHDVLPADAYVVRLWGTGSGRPLDDAAAAPPLAGREVREVFLGSVLDDTGRRWLTHEEIARGSLLALATGAHHHTIGELPA